MELEHNVLGQLSRYSDLLRQPKNSLAGSLVSRGITVLFISLEVSDRLEAPLALSPVKKKPRYAYYTRVSRKPISNLCSQTFGHPVIHRRLLYVYTRVGTLMVATIYLQLIQNRYMFRSFTVFQCSHKHCVQPVASDVEVVGYLQQRLLC